jgi:8-oxo-dGTP pyrophosphatase MutT (NUDIX family)
MTPTSIPPRPASTTILLRAGHPLEVFLIKRNPSQRFMGGTHVFPGGRMDDADLALARDGLLKHHAPDVLAAHMQLPEAEALGYLAAACRELLEEAGILLSPGATALDARWVRDALTEEQPFAKALRARGLTLDGNALAYLAHWVTPAMEPRRFSARFFVAAAPEGQPTAIDEDEAVEGAWMTPGAALACHLAQTIVLPPPTVCVIEGLCRASSLAEALLGARGPVVAMEPTFHDENGTPVLAFPGDPLHHVSKGPDGAPTRVELINGVFVPVRKERAA